MFHIYFLLFSLSFTHLLFYLLMLLLFITMQLNNATVISFLFQSDVNGEWDTFPGTTQLVFGSCKRFKSIITATRKRDIIIITVVDIVAFDMWPIRIRRVFHVASADR